MYPECISVRASGNHRIRSRYNTCCANTNVSSPTKVALYHDTRYKHDTTQDTTKYRLSVMADTYPACIPPAMTHLRSFERLGRFPDGSSSGGADPPLPLAAFLDVEDLTGDGAESEVPHVRCITCFGVSCVSYVRWSTCRCILVWYEVPCAGPRRFG